MWLVALDEPLGRGVTVARSALDRLVQVRILAAQLTSAAVCSHPVAIGAHHVALLNFLTEDSISDQAGQGIPPDVESLFAGVSVVEIHHVRWIAESAVGTRPIFGLSDDLPDGGSAPFVANDRRRPVLRDVSRVMPSKVCAAALRAIGLHPVGSANVR